MENQTDDTPVAAVVGASGGIGAAVTRALAESGRFGAVHALSRRGEVPRHARIIPGRIDIEDDESIAAAAGRIGQGLSFVFVATGLLHDGAMQPEKTWRTIDPADVARAFAVNATGPVLVAKHMLPLMPRRGRAVFAAISARVGSISDNKAGGWYGYRASKAALNQFLRCLAIEEARRRPDLVIAGLQPGTVRTALSAPFRSGVPEGDLFEPAEVADHLLGVIERLSPDVSGRVWDWRGDEVPP
jgi:NAD(P)-dependent dehydrogenase (short-subunit alcohol dehydrogenase family)